MELRVLQYFLSVAREQSVTGAAEYLHLSQPTLSRQLKDLEDEFGKQLFIRGNREITLTEEGMILRKRAEEIMDLVKKTENEITISNEVISGDIYIGTGEADGIRSIIKAAQQLQHEHHQVRFHIASGDSADVIERLNKGLLDFGILFEPTDMTAFDYLSIPKRDLWGVLMRRDSILAEKEHITPEDLWDKPLIMSRQHGKGGALETWIKKSSDELNIVATYNLIYNASLMVDEGFGYAICFDKLISTNGSNLCFKPLKPKLEASMNFVWKKYQVFNKASEKFLEKIREQL